jgi:hypothetical protein
LRQHSSGRAPRSRSSESSPPNSRLRSQPASARRSRTGCARKHSQLAEVRGLAGQTIRRLERIEGDTLAERHSRVDDLALLVDLISSGWKSVDERLTRIETAVHETSGAIVYRIEDAQERRLTG